MSAVSLLFLALTALGTLYYIASTLALISHFRRGSVRDSRFHPFVSVLKPASGADPEARRNFLSYLKQDYPGYEVLFGVLDSKDPALSVIRGIVRRARRALLRVGSDISGSNNKVRILHKLASFARGEILVVTDADTLVTPDFLSRITAPFVDERVGAVTCMYKGVEAKTVADALEGLHMTCVFGPGVASAEKLGGIDFGLGAAIAIRRDVLGRIGGFEPIADYLADDFQLGYRVAAAGYKVVLSDYVVGDVLSGANLRDMLTRELRWSRTTAVSRPWGHIGMITTYGFPYALAFCLATGVSSDGWSVLLGVTAVRALSAYVGARGCLGDKEVLRRLPLLPLRDLLSFGIWVAAYFSRTVKWRGRKLKLLKDGRMAPVK